VLHADARLLVVDKASGLLTVPGLTQPDCLRSRLAASGWPGARVVHRLDRDTSGLLVVALDDAAHRELSAQFRRREVAKAYCALVAGQPPSDAGEVDLPIRKDMVNTPLQLVDHERGKPSRTRWRVLERMPDRTRLELTPLTGRTHQLRLHLSSIGHPICGDDLYADERALRMAPRLCLHAERLAFAHPGSGERMSFSSATEAF
jgi:tRNA pseudouridine32 synthase/23S rRNA pseudouridine746 synthase